MMRPARKIRTLLVDDHPMLRKGIRHYLDDSPTITVVGEAATAAEAFRKAKLLSPDVVVLDINMPGADGAELALRLNRTMPKCRLLAFSVNAGKEYAARMARCGVRGYVVKDRPPSELAHAIECVHAGRLYFVDEAADAIMELGDTKKRGTKPGTLTLTRREKEVLGLIADGLSNKQIGRKLGISVRTVESHRENLMKKTNVRSIAGLVKYALRTGLSSLK